MSKPSETYSNIDMAATGFHLKKVTASKGLTVKMIQQYLGLSCPQPVYRWFKGQILPSVDHLYALSRLLKMHMEDLIVAKCRRNNEVILKHRIFSYYEEINRCRA